MDNCKIIQSPYEVRLIEQLNQIAPNVYNNGKMVSELSLTMGLKILTILIESACLGQNIAPITLSREQVMMIDKGWLIEYLPMVAKSSICFDDEWEYRRLLELVDEAVPQLLKWTIEQGKDSKNEEVREVSEEYSKKIG